MALDKAQAYEVVPVMIARVQSDRRANCRQLCVKVLGYIGDARALPALIAALDDSDEGVVRAAFHALGRIADPRARAVLMAALDNPEEWIVKAACGTLSLLDDPGAVEPLLRLLDDPRWFVREAACGALFELRVADNRLSAALEELAQGDELSLLGSQIHSSMLARLLAEQKGRWLLRLPSERERLAEEVTDRARRHCRWMAEEVARRLLPQEEQ